MGSQGRNDSFWLVAEWLQIKKLAEMGITVPATELSEEMLEGFILLSSELTKLDNEAMRKKSRASKRGR